LILKIVSESFQLSFFFPPFTLPADVPGHITPYDTDMIAESKLSTALGMNARLIRRSVSDFRSNVTNALQALERQAVMTSLAELKVGAAFVVKGADMKVASTTAVTAFSFDNIDFGRGPAHYAQINYQPRFDWWTIIQGAQGYGESEGGVLCSMTVEAGLKEKLVQHAAWRVLIPEAHLFLAPSDNEEKETSGAVVDKKEKRNLYEKQERKDLHEGMNEVVQPSSWREEKQRA
jgi:hypothetical protein